MKRTKDKAESSKNISDVQKQFIENLKIGKLEETIKQLNETVGKLLKKIEDKDNEILALQQRLNGDSIIKPIVLALADEELISNAQLERLKNAALNRELSLEEVKKFDLLVKNKRLSQGDSTTIVADYKNIGELPKPELLKLASRKTSGEDNVE